jgi:hypothetical protein
MKSSKKSSGVVAKTCLICGGTGTKKLPVRRGLCNKHYLSYQRAYKMVPKEKREEFEQDSIKAGEVLPMDDNVHVKRALKYMNPEDRSLIEGAAPLLDKFKKKG